VKPLLVVDDDTDVAEGMATAIAETGREVIVCYDLAAAELVVETTPLAAIVCDIRLTGPFRFEGLDFLEHAARHATGAKVVLVSGAVTEELRSEAMRRGAAAVLQKPFDMEELERLIGVETKAEEGRIIRVPALLDIVSGAALAPMFQPIVNLETEAVLGFESLARLGTDSLLGAPDLLFQYAARKNAVAQLERMCITNTFAASCDWSERRLLFINVHPAAFRDGDGLSQSIVEGAKRYRISLEQLVVELTEQQSVHDERAVVPIIDRLRDLGVRFALDDMGMAYSHLTLIDQLRPSFLKVSQHFGTAFERDPTRSKLVRNLLSLATDFNAALILEGIESASTAAAARDMGIPYGQGYHFSRPMKAAAAASWAAMSGKRS
jgi:EAL domain-containing protein (putative c-di-GMP-specific phosphodiesterase class I)